MSHGRIRTHSNPSEAARYGRFNALVQLVREGHPVDAADNRGWRPLHEAADSNYIDCLDFLLHQDQTDINWQSFDGQTALNLACIQGHVGIVRRLVDCGADPNIPDHVDTYPILNAVKVNNLYMVRQLLAHGARVNVQLYCGTSPLHKAASEGFTHMVRLLLDSGADIGIKEDYGITPLFSAAQYGHEQCCELLLRATFEQGKPDVLNAPAEDGATPLYLASQEGHLGVVQLLLENGASANLSTSTEQSSCTKAQPLHAALQFNHVECVKLLVQYTNKDSLDECDVSPFYFSLMLDQTDCTKELIKGGISASHRHLVDPGEGFKSRVLLYFQDRVKYSPRISPLVELAMNKCPLAHADVLIAGGAHVNARTPYEVPPLLAALEYGNYDLAKLLIKNGATVNIYHPKVISNMTILISYPSWVGLNLLLFSGAEARSLFASKPQSVGQPIIGTATSQLHQLEDALSEMEEDDYENEPGALRYPIPFWRNLVEARMNGSSVTIAQMLNRILQFVTVVNLDPHFQSYVDSKEDWKAICTLTDSPRTLTHICRVVIREQLGPQKLCHPQLIQSLPLPEPVIDFLLYKELDYR